MDRRTLLALLLTAIVIVITPMLFKSPRRQPPPVTTDTLAATRPDTTRDTAPAPAAQPARPAVAQPTIGAAAAPRQVRAETTLVRTEHAVYAIVSPGGTPVNVTLPAYRSLRPGADTAAPVRLLEPQDRLFRLTV